MAENTSSSTTEKPEQHTAGLFDIRFIIGALLGIYGAILVVIGLLRNDTNVESSQSINIVAGVGMLLTALFFAAWTKLRPTIVPADPEAEDEAEESQPEAD